MVNLKKLAVDVVDGKVFGSWMVYPSDLLTTLPLIFIPLSLMKERPEDAAVLYEYYERQLPECVGKYPQFASMKYLTQSQLIELVDHMRNYNILKSQFTEETNV